MSSLYMGLVVFCSLKIVYWDYANRRIPVSHKSPQGIWTCVPCDGNQTGSPLDQWDMVRIMWDCRLYTIDSHKLTSVQDTLYTVPPTARRRRDWLSNSKTLVSRICNGALRISPPAFRPSYNLTCTFWSVDSESQKCLVPISFATLYV
jgi:hypothetical protein